MKSIKFRWFGSLLVLSLAATVAFCADADQGRRGGAGFLGHEYGFFARYLDLSDAQRTKMKQTLAAEKPALKPLLEQERQSREQMLQLIQSGSFDEAKAQIIAVQESQNHIQLEVQQARIHAELYQMLTAGQKTKLSQFMAARQQRMQQHLENQTAPAQ